jgi:zinc finger SWIM domain-containing protein 3
MEKEYHAFVTPYRFERIQHQLGLSEKVENVLDACEENCNCQFFTTMELPCRHIFAVRKQQNLPLSSEYLVHIRWTVQYFTNRRYLTSPWRHLSISRQLTPRKNILNTNEKFKRAAEVLNNLQQKMIQRGMEEFLRRCQVWIIVWYEATT